MTIQGQSTRIFFNKVNVATKTYIYNGSSGTTATAGWVTCQDNEVVVHMEVATLNSSASVNYRVEGIFDGLSRPAKIYQETITTAHTIGKLINVTEKIKQIRVGVKVGVKPASPLASPVVVYSSVALTDYN